MKKFSAGAKQSGRVMVTIIMMWAGLVGIFAVNWIKCEISGENFHREMLAN